MTEDAILDVGWQMCKIVRSPQVIVWFAEEGWHGAYLFQAVPLDDKNVHIRARRYDEAVIVDDRWRAN